MSVRKGKILSLALANELWPDKMPDELKSLHLLKSFLLQEFVIHVAMLKLHLVCKK